MGMRVENAEKVLPEFQQLEVGKSLDRAGNMIVKAFEANRYLALGPPDVATPKTNFFESTWVLCLYPLGARSTRLVSRVRAYIKNAPKGWLWLALLDPGQFVMERKMLIEIKRRLEKVNTEAAPVWNRRRHVEPKGDVRCSRKGLTNK